MTLSNAPLDPATVVDRNLSAYQIGVFVLCGMVVFLDGIDTQVIGIAAPVIARELGLEPALFGWVFSAGMLGATIGALGCGVIADRIGRKPTLIFATVMFGLFTLATTFASDLTSLLAYRFATGLGLGGAVPCFVALTTEYAPARRRAMIVSLLWAAFPLGAAVGALINSYIIGELGWRSLFYVWGAVPIAVAAVHVFLLPESVRFMASRAARPARIAAILNRIEPGSAPAEARFASETRTAERESPRELFGPRLRVASGSLSLIAFLVFGLLTIGASWVPSLLTPYGFTPSAAALIVACNGFGSFVGTMSAGVLLDRFGVLRCAVPALFGAAVAFVALGLSTDAFALVAIASACAGIGLGLISSITLVLAALIYPTAIRSTGLGWTAGIGRLGSVVTPLMVGAMVAASWSIVPVMVALALMATAAIPLVVVLARFRSSSALAAAPVAPVHAAK